jgi:N-dimethylarginine dimethylaminohydrolase
MVAEAGLRRRLITRAAELDFDLRSAPSRPLETRVLMAHPQYFDVEYVINPHMSAHVGAVDKAKALQQWIAVGEAYRKLGFAVFVLPAEPGFPDYVFTANQSFPVLFADGGWGCVLSHMKHPQRRGEVPKVADWYRRAGGRVLELEGMQSAFEGMGDALWLPGHRVILGGHGFRTDLSTYVKLAQLLDVPILALELLDDRFYHLDTCLSLIDPETALYVPAAFQDEGIELLEKAFPRLLPLGEREAAELLAGNGHSPDGRHFLVQKGCLQTTAAARSLDLEVIEIETSEFEKSGGSVFCMKLMLP